MRLCDRALGLLCSYLNLRRLSEGVLQFLKYKGKVHMHMIFLPCARPTTLDVQAMKHSFLDHMSRL